MCIAGFFSAWLCRCRFPHYLFRCGMALAVCQLAPAPGSATVISWNIVPSSLSVSSGQSVSADLVLTGKPVGVAPSVGAFDFTIAFNPSILLPIGVTFGNFLGNPFLFESLTGFTFSTGSVEFAEVSLLTPAQLDALQPSNFTLATISFNALGSGSTSLLISQATVDDAFGNKIPEPGALLLVGSGLTVLLPLIRRAHGERVPGD